MVGRRLAPETGGVVQRLPLAGVDLCPRHAASGPYPCAREESACQCPRRSGLRRSPDRRSGRCASSRPSRACCGSPLIIANIGTAVLQFALFRRHSERLAIGFVTARLTECGFIAVGIVSVLAIMTLRQDPGGASDATLVALGQSLVAVHDATFLLGPGLVVGVGNGLILGYLMHTSDLMPRRLATFGLVGGPLLLVSGSPSCSAPSTSTAPPGSCARSRRSSGRRRSAST
jgi:Domain of unknown function (DUF4386)